MTSQEFGELIRTHREAKGLTVQDLASRFKLSVNTIRAIEEGSLDYMPHAVYAKGFVRACAQAVDISQEDLESGLASLFPSDPEEDPPAAQNLISTRPARQPGQNGKGGGILVSLVLLLFLGGAVWLVYANFDTIRDFASETVAAFSSPEDEGEMQNVPEPAPAPSVPESTPAPEVVSSSPPAAPTSVPQGADTPAEPQAAPEAAAPVVEPSSAPAETETSAQTPPASGKQVGIKAAEKCWVQVAVDGSASRTFTVYPGETSVLPYKTKLTIVLGNTGGVSLSHNGKPFALNGKRNERRTITFQ